MATRAWSTRFLKLYIAATSQVYTVPAGKRAIVRCIAAYNADAAASLAYVQVAGATVWARSVPGAAMTESTDLHHVAHTGETISGYIAGPIANLTVSGYLLDDPLSEPAPHTEDLELAPLPAGELLIEDDKAA